LEKTPLNPPNNQMSEHQILLEKMREEQGNVKKEWK